MLENENAVGGQPAASPNLSTGELTTGECMATTLAEVKSLPADQQERVREMIARLRQRIGKAMGELGRANESPRHVEANLRTVSHWSMSGRMGKLLEADDDVMRVAVSETLDLMDANFQPSLWEGRCESLGIPFNAYVDVYETLGLLQKLPVSDVMRRYVA